MYFCWKDPKFTKLIMSIKMTVMMMSKVCTDWEILGIEFYRIKGLTR